MNLNFTWDVISHEPKELQLQLSFEDPYVVSTSYYGNDIIKFNIRNLGMFISAENGMKMDQNSLDGSTLGKPEVRIEIFNCNA